MIRLRDLIMEQGMPPMPWKKIAKQGYDVAPGTRPPDSNVMLYDWDIAAIGNTTSAARMTLEAKLRAQNIAVTSSTGIVANRVLETGNVEFRYFSYKERT